MDANGYLGLALGFIWGTLWVLFLKGTEAGRFLALRRTWITVVVGVGGDLFILFWLLDLRSWLMVLAVVTVSSISIIAGSLIDELQDAQDLERVLDGDTDKAG